MLTRSEIKLIQSLKRKSKRDEEGLFLAEGRKAIEELLPYFRCKCLIGTEEILQGVDCHKVERVEVIDKKFPFTKISILDSPRFLLGIFVKRSHDLPLEWSGAGLSLILDSVQDPGNIGTIIRTAAWFGCKRIFMTEGTADPYSPKVVQSTMGALGQVELYALAHACDFVSSALSQGIPVYGTFLDGTPLSEVCFSSPNEDALLIMGNEGRGVSEDLASLCDKRILIPSTNLSNHPESLNVAIATAILLSRWYLR